MMIIKFWDKQIWINSADTDQTGLNMFFTVCNFLFCILCTVKFLNFWTPDNYAVIYLKFKQRGKTLGDANGIADSEDSDQTAPLGAVWSGSALFAQTNLSKNLGTLR